MADFSADFAHSSDWPGELDDRELEELDRFLRAHAGDEHLLLDGVHGLLTAIGIGPESIAPEEWLPEVLHAPFDDDAQGRRVLALLARLRDSVDSEIEGDRYEPILGEVDLDNGQTGLSAQGWCEGFSRGVDLRARQWESRLNADSHLTELLGPIMALAVEEGVFSTDADFAPLSEQEYGDCVAQLPIAVHAVANYWHQVPLSPEERSDHAAARVEEEKGRKRGGQWLH